MSIKEKFESHPVVFGLSLLAVGFTAGFAARGYFLSEFKNPEAPAHTVQKATICQVENLAALEGNHGQRVLKLQETLMVLEAKATDEMKISSYQQKYKESAERVRNDIAKENENYQSAIKQLNLRCKQA
ncbi:hypothetical protein [Rheinheimera baltica]|uniref:hypothetical protein n=1 Tax=Rheinheimera baltica TaxID=67576 RepID=UPI0012EC2895|nr:hypothetical protein [Rheinheimera baltica]